MPHLIIAQNLEDRKSDHCQLRENYEPPSTKEDEESFIPIYSNSGILQVLISHHLTLLRSFCLRLRRALGRAYLHGSVLSLLFLLFLFLLAGLRCLLLNLGKHGCGLLLDLFIICIVAALVATG